MPLFSSSPMSRSSVCLWISMPVGVYDQQGHMLPHPYVFNQGDVPFLGSQHLPYASSFSSRSRCCQCCCCSSIPCSCFQVCLNRTGCSCQSLHTFMDAFQGHYKNGTNGTRDLRFFSGLYLLLRHVLYASTVLTYQISSFAQGFIQRGGPRDIPPPPP